MGTSPAEAPPSPTRLGQTLWSSVSWAHLGLVSEVTATCWWAVVLQSGVPSKTTWDNPVPTSCPLLAAKA